MPGLRPFIVRRLAGFFVLAALAIPALPRGEPTVNGSLERKREAWLEAYRKGMPLDSLYYLLAGDALRRLSFDTAMAFNLSIPSPAGGSFRDSVLSQRYRLYQLSGLREDAARLEDSLPALPKPAPVRRPVTWELRARSGYSGERQGPARSHSSGREIAGIDTGGWTARSQGTVNLPIPSPAWLPLGIGLGYDIAKSYYKDSLDYRAEIGLKADRILDGISAGFYLEAGSTSSLGPVAALKGDLTWIAFGDGGFWLGHAGYESEWERYREKRYDAAWITLLREWDLGAGRSFQGFLSGTLLLMDPIRVPQMNNVIYVDDVSKTNPLHYRGADFQDSIPRVPAMSALFRYTEPEVRGSTSFTIPQDVFTLNPGISYGMPLGSGFKAEVGMGYGFSLHPEGYSSLEVQGGDPAPGDTGDFRGYALNRADGRYYRADLVKRNGGFDETYGAVSRRERMDHRMEAELTMIKSLARWGEVRLEMGAERSFSDLLDRAPFWTPEWEYGASIRWSKSGRWRK